MEPDYIPPGELLQHAMWMEITQHYNKRMFDYYMKMTETGYLSEIEDLEHLSGILREVAMNTFSKYGAVLSLSV